MTYAKNARNSTGLPIIRPLGQFVARVMFGQSGISSGMVIAYVDRVTMIYVNISTAAGVEGKGREVGFVKPGVTGTNVRFRILFASLCVSQVLGMLYF